MAGKPKNTTANYSADDHNATRRDKKAKDRSHRGKHPSLPPSFSMPAERRQTHEQIAIDHDLQAFKAYLHVMLSDDAPQLDSLEHRAVMLMRDFYPSTKRENGGSKMFMTRQRVFLHFKKRAGAISLPDVLINEIAAGLRKMSTALVLVGDSTAYGCGIATDTLEAAIDKLLVMNESSLEPKLTTARAA